VISQTLAVINTLQSKGWRVAPLHEGWQLSRVPVEGTIQMSITPHGWLCLTLPLDDDFAITALLSEGEHGYRVLLERNVEMFLAKFALDRDLTPLLMVEVGLKDADPMLAYWAVEALVQYKTQKRLETVTEVEWAMAGPLTPEYDVFKVVNIKLKSTLPILPDIIGGVPDDTIKLYLDAIEHAGWRVKKKLDGFSWHLLYRGRHQIFNVYLSSSRTWMYFQVQILYQHAASVLTASDDHPDARQLRTFFLKYLLRLNQNWFFAKVGISTDDQVLLLLEVPTSLLDFALFRQAIHSIEIYLDRFEQEIQIMASIQHNPRLFGLLRTSSY
jgi:hypothetical protein